MSYDKLIKYDYKTGASRTRAGSWTRRLLTIGLSVLIPALAAAIYLFYPAEHVVEAELVEIQPMPTVIPLALPNQSAPENAVAIEKLERTIKPETVSAPQSVSDDKEVLEPVDPSPEIAETVADITESVSPPEKQWDKVTIGKGDNLSLIFGRQGLSPSLLYRIINHDDQTRALKRVMPGQELHFQIEDGQLREMRYISDMLTSLHIKVSEDGLSSQKIVLEPSRKVVTTTAEIDSSLFLAAMNAGLSDNLTMQLAEIFGWDIDFALSIRKGDRFSVIYEELYKEETKIRDGAILAAEFINQGRSYRAIRYQDASGHADYYSDTGDSMRKAFLRTPVKFSRISSRFSLGRKHPVLNRIRAHRGVDYAAPRGTPVKASGDGKITLVGRKGGYGKTVILQHGGAYSTLYAHLNSYAKGVRNGKHVRQGQVIGYVGSTGLATGPHLHYEFRVNGVHRNPLTVKLPKATPIPKEYLADFKNKAGVLTAQLDSIASAEAASLSESETATAEPTRLAANQH